MRVVAAAILRDGRVLAARRLRPERLAGGWEFPGGKVEAGEDERSALVRECVEELGVQVEVAERLGVAEEGELSMVLYATRLGAGEPAAGADHDAIRWLTAAELDGLGWLPIDRTLLPAVRAVLGQRSGSGRAESAAATAAPDATNPTAASISGDR